MILKHFINRFKRMTYKHLLIKVLELLNELITGVINDLRREQLLKDEDQFQDNVDRFNNPFKHNKF